MITRLLQEASVRHAINVVHPDTRLSPSTLATYSCTVLHTALMEWHSSINHARKSSTVHNEQPSTGKAWSGQWEARGPEGEKDGDGLAGKVSRANRLPAVTATCSRQTLLILNVFTLVLVHMPGQACVLVLCVHVELRAFAFLEPPTRKCYHSLTVLISLTHGHID